MAYTMGLSRTFGRYIWNPRRRINVCLIIIILAFIVTAIIITVKSVHLASEDEMEERIVEIKSHLQFLQSQYRGRQEDVMSLQAKVLTERGNETPHHIAGNDTPPISAEVMALLRNISGTKTASGLNPKLIQQMKIPFVMQLLPHLMNDPNSLKPAFHLKSPKLFAEVVIGIPTVKRDKENYLQITLKNLVSGLAREDFNTTLIVVMIGEVDLEYVMLTSKQIEETFPKEVEAGLIEVISPSASYYPDLENILTSLGDSYKRTKWRTKQNLDTIYLMAYGHCRGALYLMLEDDVIANVDYLKDVKQYSAKTTLENPHWVFIDYGQVGGIGKLFKSPDLVNFIIYVQLFYTNMPIDWLLESYLADRVCAMDKTSKICSANKLKIRPKYKTSLFQHIGVFSSLKGKIQKIKANLFTNAHSYYPHDNPPLKRIESNITEHGEHTLKNAYEGKNFFWGIKPKKGDVIEFWFEQPIRLDRFTLRSGNPEHTTDKFYYTLVEAIPFIDYGNITVLASFDEFGLADGWVDQNLGLLAAIRLRVVEDNRYWAILSEIEFRPWDAHNTSGNRTFTYGNVIIQPRE